jgi:hypothetical protein
MPTMSVEICRCGTEMEYIGPDKNTLHCVHCDEVCTVQQDNKALGIKRSCLKCDAFSDEWKNIIAEVYGPGRSAS